MLKTDARARNTSLKITSKQCCTHNPDCAVTSVHYSSRIQDFASAARYLPDHEVACFVHAAQKRGVEVGKCQVCDGPGEALQQGAFSKTHTEDTDHCVVVGPWEKMNNHGTYLVNIGNNTDAIFLTDHHNTVNQKFWYGRKTTVYLAGLHTSEEELQKATEKMDVEQATRNIRLLSAQLSTQVKLTSNGVGQKGVGHRY